MKLAYFCEPQVGGTFTFFLRLRDGLRRRGLDARCVPPISGQHFAGTPFAGLDGVDYVTFPDEPAAATRVLVDHLTRTGVDVALTLPGCDLLTTNLVRYLPAHIRTVARVPMMTRGAYRPVVAVADHLDRVVGVCRRIRDDLLADYGLPADQVCVIENGADIERFAAPPRESRPGQLLRVLYVGRLEDVQKCVLLLPDLAAALHRQGVRVQLTVAGDGPDAGRLRERFARVAPGQPVDFLGTVRQDDLPALYARHDVYVLPTRFEGTPNALLEAMAAGCVPVVTRLPGSLDVIVEEGRSGWLCAMGDAADFARRVAGLDRDRAQLVAFSCAAQDRMRSVFTQERMIDRYLAMLDEVCAAPSRRLPPLDLGCYTVPPALRPSWRRWVPPGLKKVARTLLGRMGRSV